MTPLIRKIKAGPLEAEFEREVRELQKTVDPTTAQDPKLTSEWQSSVEQLARLNPRAAILEAWRQAEMEAIRKLRANLPGLSETQARSTREVLRLLRELGLATSEDVEMLNQLRYLRNQAGHVESFQPTYEAAITFVQLAEYLVARIR